MCTPAFLPGMEAKDHTEILAGGAESIGIPGERGWQEPG